MRGRAATLKVLAGALRGRSLEAPADATTLRPTAARRRAAVFDILRSRLPTFRGRRFADLFAGTGAVAIEALSQGFDAAHLVEADPAAVALIRRNLKGLGLEAQARVVAGDATRLGRTDRPFDVVFMDPPYQKALAAPAIEALVAGGWLADDGVVLAEVAKGAVLDPRAGLVVAGTYRHGAGSLLRLERG